MIAFEKLSLIERDIDLDGKFLLTFGEIFRVANRPKIMASKKLLVCS